MLDSKKKKIVVEIDNFVKKFKKKSNDINKIVGSPKLMKYMDMFKKLMDNCTQGELDSFADRFDGFYEFSLFLENFASATKDGIFDDLL